MKTIQITILALCLFCITGTNAQTSKEKPILKVTYITDNVSDFMVNMLKGKIADPNEYSKFMSKISDYKIYHSLYQNTATKETLYVLDSIHKVPGVSTVGHNHYVYKDSKGILSGKEGFMGKDFAFQGNSKDLVWEISKTKKDINGRNSVRANLKNNPDIYVWFTSEIAADIGPYIYGGLPGLILESNGIFQNIVASTVSYVDQDVFESNKNKFVVNIDGSDKLSVLDVISKKENFKLMAEKGRN